MIFLILESLGSTELAFILVMALVFFGPRKLPQLSRTLGRNLASFRRASEDFKRTWEKEVSLEELNMSRLDLDPGLPGYENSILNTQSDSQQQPLLPTIETVEPELTVPRQSKTVDKEITSHKPNLDEPAEPPAKRDWL